MVLTGSPNVDTAHEGLRKPGIVVVANGFPGTGKFSILQKVHDAFADGTSRFVDNHQLIDPAASVYPDRGPKHHAMRRRIRGVVFAELRQVAQKGATVLMTACLAGNDEDAEVMSEHFDIVRHSNVPILWINMHCDQKTLKERATGSDRCQGSKTKLTNWGVLSKIITESQLIEPSKYKQFTSDVFIQVAQLEASGNIEDAVEGTKRLILEKRH